MSKMYKTPKCCKKAEGGGGLLDTCLVRWSKKKDGWSINIQRGQYDPAWKNVNFCPFCGVKLND